MASLNKVFILGRLGADPELRYTPGGQAVANLNVATNSWSGKGEQREERTEWHRVVVWGKQAESCDRYLKKGREVFVEGRLQTSSWEDKDGNKRYRTEINAMVVQFIGGMDSGDAPRGGGGERGPARPQDDQPKRQTQRPTAPEPEMPDDDDFPF